MNNKKEIKIIIEPSKETVNFVEFVGEVLSWKEIDGSKGN